MNAAHIDGLVSRLAHFATRSHDIDHDALVLQLADASIALMAGAASAEGRRVASFFEWEGGALAHAATLAATMRLTEIDDIHRASGVTPSAIVLPAALGMCSIQRDVSTAGQFAAALHVGETLAVALAQSLGGAAIMGQGWWPSLTVAPFGAAATAGRLLGLTSREMAHALAIALAQTPVPIGRTAARNPARWLLFGQAVRTGCAAALAAQQGFEGDPTLLDNGWLRRGSGLGVQSDSLIESIGLSVRKAVSVKPHPGAKQTMSAIHAFGVLLAEHGAPSDIDAIHVFVPTAYAAMIVREPPQVSRLASFVSAHGQLALAAVAPRALDDADRSTLAWTDSMQRIASRISVSADPSLDAYYPAHWPARVCIVTKGRRHEVTATDSPGDPALPFDVHQMRDKAERILGHHAGIDLLDSARRAASDAAALHEWSTRLSQGMARGREA